MLYSFWWKDPVDNSDQYPKICSPLPFANAKIKWLLKLQVPFLRKQWTQRYLKCRPNVDMFIMIIFFIHTKMVSQHWTRHLTHHQLCHNQAYKITANNKQICIINSQLWIQILQFKSKAHSLWNKIPYNCHKIYYLKHTVYVLDLRIYYTNNIELES